MTAPKLLPVPHNNESKQGRRDRHVKTTSSPDINETVTSARESLLPQTRHVNSKVLGIQGIAGDTTMATKQATIMEEDESRQSTAEPTPSIAASPQGASDRAEVPKPAHRAVAGSSVAISKVMGPPKALGRSQTVRGSDAAGNGVMNIPLGRRPRPSANSNLQASALATYAAHRLNPSHTKPDVQSSERSVLGQASAAANQHRRSVSNVSGSGADAVQDTNCSSVKTLKDEKQKSAISSTQRANSARSGSVPPKSLHMPKVEDRDSKPQARISSAPSGQPAKARRPEFTTLQQQFTPKKNSKPPSASYFLRSPNKQPGMEVLLPETLSLQTELLQMHVLHRSSYIVQCQWERSAEQVFRQRFEKLLGHYAELMIKEHDAQERLNLLALTDWCQDFSTLQLAEKAQVLSQTIQDVQIMTDPGGKYTRIISVFEQWFAWSSRLLQSRKEREISAKQEVEFVEDLGDGWKAGLAVLERKLASVTREFRRLGPAREGSSLASILKVLREMITTMQDEITSMRIIETQILIQEQAWVAGLIDDLTSNISSGLLSSTASLRKGIWQEAG